MGISGKELLFLKSQGLFSQNFPRILDVGCQNVHATTQSEILEFMIDFIDAKKDELQAFTREVERGSDLTPFGGRRNGVYLGQILDSCGFDYQSIDYSIGYKTRKFDLNLDALPQEDHGAFDVVLNLGTSEHVMDQLAVFKLIHDATKVGGFMYHSVPHQGYYDHGFYNYHPLFFVRLAEANGYKVKSLHLSAGQKASEQAYCPSFEPVVSNEVLTVTELLSTHHRVVDSSVSAIFEKVDDIEFKIPMELSTMNIPLSHRHSEYSEDDRTYYRRRIYTYLDTQVDTARDFSANTPVQDLIHLALSADDINRRIRAFLHLRNSCPDEWQQHNSLKNEVDFLENVVQQFPDRIDASFALDEARQEWFSEFQFSSSNPE